jgi:hypothetical protein
MVHCERKENDYNILAGKPERVLLEDLGINGMLIHILKDVLIK